MLQSELPRVRKLVKDSWPGVSMMRRPGILYSRDPSYEKARLQLCLLCLMQSAHPVDDLRLFLDGLYWEVSGTNLLCDTSSFALLDIGLTDLCPPTPVRTTTQRVRWRRRTLSSSFVFPVST